MSYEPTTIEARWQERWAESDRYEENVDQHPEGETTFVSVAYPCPSGGMHLGHARTYTVPDVYARYRRQQGDTVLFPMAWHVTGTPIIGAVERLKNGDESQRSVLRETYDVSEEALQELETPMGFTRYFIEHHFKRAMKRLGLSIDWRREFTTNDERYQRFIMWQYETLKEHGLLEKGLHPVKYCTEQENSVTAHDILEGEDVDFKEYILIRFRSGETVFPAATLRSETVRAVTNVYIDPAAKYVEATVDGESWMISAEAAEKLALQDRDVSVTRTVNGEALIGTRVRSPVTDENVLILPADFVDADTGSGIVPSAPAHSPDDYVALQNVQDNAHRLKQYGLDPDEIAAIDPISVLSVEGYGEVPAKEIVETTGIESSDDSQLKQATQELYSDEYHQGVVSDEHDEFGGEVVKNVRDDLAAYFQDRGVFDTMYDFPEPVISRSGGKVVVAYQDTWFLRYNDAEWKEKAHQALERLDAIPETTREQLDYTID